MDNRLSDAPHHGVGGHHAEAAVLVHKCDGGRGEEAERAGDDGPHHQDHHAVELAKLVAAQHAEGDNGGDAVEEDRGDETPHEHRHPET